MRGALALVAVLLVVAAAGGGSSRAAAPTLHDPHPCPDAPGATCSTLDVPLDRSGRTGGTLHLAVGAADNANAPRGVLLVLTGGPGQPGVPSLARSSRLVGAELHDYRVVMYDQRGTSAGALDCEPLQQAMGTSDLFPPPAAAVRACAAQLGARRQFYGTDDVVADMDALRRALGVEKWALDGISYGTYVAERYALAHPANVSKVVLDSVVPHVGLSDLGVVEFRGTRRVLRDVCGDACVNDLAAVVRAHHIGPAMLDALTALSILDPTYRTVFDVPALLHDARAGRTAGLVDFLREIHAMQSAPAQFLDQGLHASALCADWRYPWGTSAAPLAGRRAKLQRAVAKLKPADLFPFDRQTALDNGFIGQCLPWSPTAPTPLAAGKLRVPALLVNGDHDLSTPLEWARQELKLAPRGKLVVVTGAGHSVQSRAVSDRGRQAVAAFLLG
jgi:pimeloyl-ACP methyl ester carboxylesterase